MKSTYLARFQEASKHFNLFGSKLLVERLEVGELKTSGGIIIAQPSNVRSDIKSQTPHIGMVLATGKGYFDDVEKDYVPLEVKPGNVVVLNGNGVMYFSTLPGSSNYASNKIGLTTEGDIQMIFEDLAAFEAYVAAIGGPDEESTEAK